MTTPLHEARAARLLTRAGIAYDVALRAAVAELLRQGLVEEVEG